MADQESEAEYQRYMQIGEEMDIPDDVKIVDSDLLKSMNQQVAVMSAALSIYAERGETRGELWARFDPQDAFHHMRSKLARIATLLPPQGTPLPYPEPLTSHLVDEGLDLINYVAFMLRHITGEKPDVEPIDI